MEAEALFIEPQTGRGPIIQLIQSAKTSIQLWMFEIEDPCLISTLIEAKKRGVSVEIITKNPATIYTFQTPLQSLFYKQLQEGDVSIIFASSAFTFMHAKTMIIDQQKGCIMSLNFGTFPFVSSRDYGLIFENQQIINYLGELFKCDLKNASENTNYTVPNPPNSLVVSPLNAKNALFELLSRTTTSAILSTENFDAILLNTLHSLVNKGCYVRLIISRINEMDLFKDAIKMGIDIRVLTSGILGSFENLFNHGKAWVIDGAYCFIGSQNLTTPSFTENREMGYLTDNPKIAIQLLTALEETWQLAKPYQEPLK